MSKLHTLTIRPKSTSAYKIFIQEGGLNSFIENIFSKHCKGKICFVLDLTVSSHHKASLEKLVNDHYSSKKTYYFSFPAGENSKTRETKTNLEDFLLSNKFDRSSTLVAFGGGVTGDITGYVAATLHRGVTFIQIPTTVISMVDSSVGGKTGIDTPYGKNLLGAFYQPAAVYIDPHLLKTLPDSEYIGGLSEIIKAAIIDSTSLFNYLNKHSKSLLERDPTTLRDAIVGALKIKQKAVKKDELEKLGYRRILNFGHTVAHAIEQLSHYRYSHGVAVWMGLFIENAVAHQMKLISSENFEKINDLIACFQVDAKLPSEFSDITSINQLIELMKLDKKAASGTIYMSLPCKIGAMCKGEKNSYRVAVSDSLLTEILSSN